MPCSPHPQIPENSINTKSKSLTSDLLETEWLEGADGTLTLAR